MRKVVCVTTMVLVEMRDGVEADDATVKLAADTANRRGIATSANITASVISRDMRILAEEGRKDEGGRQKAEGGRG
jgi:hypothetical protein